MRTQFGVKVGVDAILDDAKLQERLALGRRILPVGGTARVSDERCRHGGSVRIGSRFRNCFRTIQMRRSWLRFGGGRGDRLPRPLDDVRETNLLVNVLPHRNISRRGDDLHLTAAAIHAAMLLRSNRRVDVLGRSLDVPLRPEYADGRWLRLAGQAEPNLRNPKRRGDLHISFAVTDEKRGTDEPRSRLGRLPRFARTSMAATLNTVGLAREVIHRSVLSYRTVKYAIRRNWEPSLSALKILAIVAAVLGVGVAVYFIIVNIVAILTAIAVCFIIGGLLYALFVCR